MDPHTLKKLNAARRERQACAVVTELASGRERLVMAGDLLVGALGDEIAACLRTGKPKRVDIGSDRFFINVHVPAVRIVAIGAVHITQALAPIAVAAGYDLTVIDPRSAFASASRFAGTTLHAEWPEDVFARQPLDAFCALIAVSHDPKIDDLPLAVALEAGCFYVGALGSKKSHEKRLERLAAMGTEGAALENIRAPIGIDIGAATPGEIAVAIMAEIVLALRGAKHGYVRGQ